ncbi:hypothetical protein Elgi_32370 [Paenibacillus elgii]|nr:hypothetical protein Elgi_32370 [Paenibacillus elgii]
MDLSPIKKRALLLGARFFMGESALAILELHEIDILLTDIKMKAIDWCRFAGDPDVRGGAPGTGELGKHAGDVRERTAL